MSKYQTNVELVTRMMEYSQAGALVQAFVIEAIANYAEQTLEAEPWPAGHFINQDAWKLCAKECLSSIQNRNL